MWFSPLAEVIGKTEPRAAGPIVADAKDEAFQAREHKGAGAHGTGFLRDKECATLQPPIPERVGGLRNGEDLRMRRGIFEQFHLIVGAGDDFESRTMTAPTGTSSVS